jgi:hypothetical protein
MQDTVMQRAFAERRQDARTSLRAYVARRRANGDTVEIERDVYFTSIYARAILVVNGKRRRMMRMGAWRYA